MSVSICPKCGTSFDTSGQREIPGLPCFSCAGNRYPGFEVLVGRKPTAEETGPKWFSGEAAEPRSQDDYEYYTGTGAYYGPEELTDYHKVDWNGWLLMPQGE